MPDYLKQLEKSILFIENNLKEKITAYDAAEAAGYSYYHFHRVFEAVLGETIGSYIRTRRLASASRELIYSDKRIIDISMEYQFESQEAFHRAFKKQYGVTPGSYRKSRIDTIIGVRKGLSITSLRHLCSGVTVQPKVKTIDEVMLVGIKGSITLENNKLLQMWKTFNSCVDKINDTLPGKRGYGVCIVDPDFDIKKFTSSTETNHFIGTEVSSFERVPEEFKTMVLSGGKYAVFTHRGKISELQMTYDYIWGTSVLCSGYELDIRDDFELYDERFISPEDENSEFDIYIPVK